MGSCHMCSGTGSTYTSVSKSCSSCNGSGKAYGYGQICGHCSGTCYEQVQEQQKCTLCYGAGNLPGITGGAHNSSSKYTSKSGTKHQPARRSSSSWIGKLFGNNQKQQSQVKPKDINGPIAVIALVITVIAIYDKPKDNFGFALFVGFIAAYLSGKYYKLIISFAVAGFILYALVKNGSENTRASITPERQIAQQATTAPAANNVVPPVVLVADIMTGVKAYESKDYRSALSHFKILAEQGQPEAQNYLGEMYRYGQGVKQDEREAETWYRYAANQGHAEAQNNLGLLYLYMMFGDGRNVEYDSTEALKWFRSAADQGNADAQFNLGRMYRSGAFGIEQNYGEAMKWYLKAANQGYAKAQNSLGEMYEEGKGTSQNYIPAFIWYDKAAKQGNQDAQQNLTRLNKAR